MRYDDEMGGEESPSTEGGDSSTEETPSEGGDSSTEE
jgi:hypothetical protein